MRFLPLVSIFTCILVGGGISPVHANSTPATVTVSIVELPSFTPPGGMYADAQTVVLHAATALQVRYTVDGTNPTCSTGTVYTDPVPVASSLTLKAISCHTGGHTSAIVSHLYTIGTSSAQPSILRTGSGGAAGDTPYVLPLVTVVRPPQKPLTPPMTPIVKPPLVPVTVLPQKPTASSFVFTRDLQRGMTHADVRQLQIRLQTLGFFPKTTKTTTYFGPATFQAVLAFQRARKITPIIGRVGPRTREVLNGKAK